MSARNQFTISVPRTVLRQWAKKFDGLLDERDQAEEKILLAIHQAACDGLSNAAIAGMLAVSPSSIPAKVAKAEKILAERNGKTA